MFGVVFTQELHSSDTSAIDWKIAAGCFVLMGVCVIAARRQLMVLVVSIGTPSVFLFQRFAFAGDVEALGWGIVFRALSLGVLVVAGLVIYLRDR